MAVSLAPHLINGSWTTPREPGGFQAFDPKAAQPLPERFPIATLADLETALAAAHQAAGQLRDVGPPERARFLERYAARIEARRDELAQAAERETALPQKPRLLDVELPRTTDQLRQAAAATLERSWALPTIDTKTQLRSMYLPLGPVVIFGPNNFPFAYNAVSGGDFAAAIAAGNPVIAKGHPAHPRTTQLLAEEACAALREAGLPPATIQMVYHTAPEGGEKLVTDSRVGAVAFTGSRRGGLALKAKADAVGKPIFLEMGSLNPVVLLPGALAERFEQVVEQVVGSCLLGMGQFCTNPGLLFLVDGADAQRFLDAMVAKYRTTPVGTLLTSGVQKDLAESIAHWRAHGAALLAGGEAGGGAGYSHQHSLLRVQGRQFLAQPHALQREAFGNATLAVVTASIEELAACLKTLEGQLAGSFYSSQTGADDLAYALLEPIMRRRVGRMLNDKMPTGVAVCSAQNHGGPYPATGHPHFTAVGFPATIRRFAMLACYDHVRPARLPPELQNPNPTGKTWRLIDGNWSQGDVS